MSWCDPRCFYRGDLRSQARAFRVREKSLSARMEASMSRRLVYFPRHINDSLTKNTLLVGPSFRIELVSQSLFAQPIFVVTIMSLGVPLP